MATNDIRTNLGDVTDFMVTNLLGLGSGQIWRSNRIQEGSPHSDQVMISFSLLCDAAVAADETIKFYHARSDEASASEIVDGGIATTEGKLTAANDISDVQDGVDLNHTVRIDRVNQRVKGSFIVFSPGPSWQLLIEIESVAGGFAGSGSIVRYRLGTPQIQP